MFRHIAGGQSLAKSLGSHTHATGKSCLMTVYQYALITGNIVVDGIAASIFPDGPLGLSEGFEQGFFAPFRAAWHLAPGLMHWVHRTRAVPRLLIGLQHLAVKVRGVHYGAHSAAQGP